MKKILLFSFLTTLLFTGIFNVDVSKAQNKSIEILKVFGTAESASCNGQEIPVDNDVQRYADIETQILDLGRKRLLLSGVNQGNPAAEKEQEIEQIEQTISELQNQLPILSRKLCANTIAQAATTSNPQATASQQNQPTEADLDRASNLSGFVNAAKIALNQDPVGSLNIDGVEYNTKEALEAFIQKNEEEIRNLQSGQGGSQNQAGVVQTQTASSPSAQYNYQGATFNGPGLRGGANIVRGQLDNNISKERDLKRLIIGWTNFITSVVALLAVVALVWAGTLYVTAFGDDSRMESAKKIVIWVVIGIILILGAYAIVNTVMQAVFA